MYHDIVHTQIQTYLGFWSFSNALIYLFIVQATWKCALTHSQSQTYSISSGPKHTDSHLTWNDTHTHKPTATHSLHSSRPRFHLSTHWLWNSEKHTPTLNAAPAQIQRRPASGTHRLGETRHGHIRSIFRRKQAGFQPEVLMSSVTHSYKQTLLNGGGSCDEGLFRHLSVEFSVQMCCWLTSIWAVLNFEGSNMKSKCAGIRYATRRLGRSLACTSCTINNPFKAMSS